ncbi:PKD domain-containing protein [Patescibacteria group bacterium]|nr:PKD domain-containing protein [Patescibacteria group bacterium]
MSGYAWSSNIGWIDFSGGTVDMLTGNLSGWAQVLSPVGQPLEISGGWDGKISLTGVRINSNFTPSEFEEYAWGSEVVGWVSFNCSNESSCGTSNYKVTTNLTFNAPPEISELTITNTGGSTANCDRSEPPVKMEWIFNDTGEQGGYDIELANNINLTNPITINSLSPTPIQTITGLEFGKEYYWRIKVYDSHSPSADSGWLPTPLTSFTTNPRWPNPNFTWSPAEPLAEHNAIFTNTTTYCPVSSCDYLWNFGDGSPIIGTISPTHAFDNPGSYLVKLTATNSVGSCTNDDNTIIVGDALPLPVWQETKPF